MTTQPIIESGMTFGPYPEGHCFYIEKSNLYKNIEKNVKIAEFLLLRPQTGNRPDIVFVVEAKPSSPQPGSQPNFDGFIVEIKEKLSNSLSLAMAACLKRHPKALAEVPSPFLNLDLSKVDFRLVLVINGHQEDWLPPLQDALQQTLYQILYVTRKIWNLPGIKVEVINHTMAKDYGLII